MTGDHDLDCASDSEVRSAIEALGVEKLRLYSWGRKLIRIAGRFSEYQEPQDLFQEAIFRTLDRTRRWNPQKVSFVGHLMGAMKSIASHLHERYGEDVRNIPTRMTDLLPLGKEDDHNPLNDLPCGAPLPDRILQAKQILDRMERAVEDDEEAFNVLMLVAEGKKRSEIAEELGITSKQVHAAIERVRYKIAKADI